MSDPVIITRPPIIEQVVGGVVHRHLRATNPPNNWSADPVPAGLSFDEATGLFTGSFLEPGFYSVSVVASNDDGDSEPIELRWDVGPQPPPVITSLRWFASPVGEAFVLQLTATYQPLLWTADPILTGLEFDPQTGIFTGALPFSGPAPRNVVITASNGAGVSAPRSLLFIGLGSAIPVIQSTASLLVRAGQSFTFTPLAANQPTGWTASPLPTGVTLNAVTGTLAGTIADADVYTISLVASNDAGDSVAQAFSITVTPPPVPEITSAAAVAVLRGTAFTFTPAATNTPIAWIAHSLPDGLSFDAATGAFGGIFTRATQDSFDLIAVNTNGYSDPQTVVITVTEPPVPTARPFITSAPTAAASAGIAWSYTARANGSPTSWAVADALPSGIALASETGILSGTFAAAGTYRVTLQATNAAGTSDPFTLTITVVLAIVIGQRVYLDLQTGDLFESANIRRRLSVLEIGLGDGSILASIINGIISPAGATPGKFRFVVKAITGSTTPTVDYDGTALLSGTVDIASVPASGQQLTAGEDWLAAAIVDLFDADQPYVDVAAQFEWRNGGDVADRWRRSKLFRIRILNTLFWADITAVAPGTFVQNTPSTLLTGGSTAALDHYLTTNLAVNRWSARVVRLLDDTWTSSEWFLIAGTDAEDAEAGIVRPDDYDVTDNPKIWVRVSGL